LDPQILTSHKEHIRCLAESAAAALRQVADAEKKTICGVGISAAGCVKFGKLCGIPPAMGGVRDSRETRQDSTTCLRINVCDSFMQKKSSPLGCK